MTAGLRWLERSFHSCAMIWKTCGPMHTLGQLLGTEWKSLVSNPSSMVGFGAVVLWLKPFAARLLPALSIADDESQFPLHWGLGYEAPGLSGGPEVVALSGDTSEAQGDVPCGHAALQGGGLGAPRAGLGAAELPIAATRPAWHSTALQPYSGKQSSSVMLRPGSVPPVGLTGRTAGAPCPMSVPPEEAVGAAFVVGHGWTLYS